MTDLDPKFTTRVQFIRSEDYRDEPNDGRGARGVDIFFALIGPLGAITFRVATGWLLRPLTDGYVRGAGKQARLDKPGVDRSLADAYPSTMGVHSHSRTKDRDYWTQGGPCEWLGGGVCYGDMGYSVADRVFEALVRDGDEGVWRELREFYADWLGPERVEAVTS